MIFHPVTGPDSVDARATTRRFLSLIDPRCDNFLQLSAASCLLDPSVAIKSSDKFLMEGWYSIYLLRRDGRLS